MWTFPWENEGKDEVEEPERVDRPRYWVDGAYSIGYSIGWSFYKLILLLDGRSIRRFGRTIGRSIGWSLYRLVVALVGCTIS